MTNLIEIKNNLNDLKSNIDSLTGQCSILQSQINIQTQNLEDFAYKTELYKKEVELMLIVEKSTKGIIKEGFEKIVTFALQFILCDDDYSLEVDFGKRGNLQTVDFNLKTPTATEPHPAGGACSDILSLALRIALLELTRDKGFLTLDEPFSQFDNINLDNGAKFIKSISEKMGRQIIMITHHKENHEIADKLISIGKDKDNL